MRLSLKLALFMFFVFFAVAAAEGSGMYLEVMTDEAVIKFKEEEFDATGGILFQYDDIKIKAFKIKKVKDKNVVIAKEKVIFQQGDKTVEADEIEVNLDTKEAVIKDGGTLMDKIYYGGEMFYAKFPDVAVVKNAYFSTCELEEPHYHFEARKIEFYPGRKIVAYNTFLYIGNVRTLWLPMYLSSVKSDGQRATLFPKIGSSEKEGNYVVWGIEYELNKKFLKGFMDLEWSDKKGYIINQWSNDYEFNKNNSGNLKLKDFLIPKKNAEKEWDFIWTHKIKRDKQEGKLFGEGNWDLYYENQTTNLLEDADGNPLPDSDQKKLRKYQLKGTQKIGEDMSVAAEVLWSDSEILKQIIDNDETNNNGLENQIIKNETDNEIYQKLSVAKDNMDYRLAVDYDKRKDLDPGRKGDDYSYIDSQKLELNLKRYKLRFNYSDSDRDVYKSKTGDLYTTIKEYDYKKDYTYSLVLGDYSIFNTGLFYGLNYKRTEKNYFKRRYTNEEAEEYVKDTDGSIDTKYTEYGARVGHSGIPLYLLGKMSLAYDYGSVEFDSGETLEKHKVSTTLSTDVFDNTNNEAGKFDLVIKNEIPASYSFAKGQAPTKSEFPDKTLEIGDKITVNLGNTNNSYKINYSETKLDETDVKSSSSMTHNLSFGVEQEALNFSLNTGENYYESGKNKDDRLSGSVELRGKNRSYRYTRTKSKYYDEATGIATTDELKDSYSFIKGKLNLSYDRTYYTAGSIASGVLVKSSDTIKDSVTAKYEFEKNYIIKTLETTYTQGYNKAAATDNKVDGVLNFRYIYKDNSYQKKKEEKKEEKKAVAVTNALFLTEEELKKAQEMYESDKNKLMFDLQGLGKEEKKQQLDESKLYELGLATTVDRNYSGKNGLSIDAMKSLEFNGRFKYSTLVDWTGKINFARTKGGEDLTDRKYLSDIQLQVGTEENYKWWIGYTINYTDKEGGKDKSQITKQKYYIKKQLHCTILEMNYEKNWNESESKYDDKWGVVFSIVAFPEKGFGVKYENQKPGFEAGM